MAAHRQDAKHEREAETQGWTLVGPGKNKAHRTYRRIECGHEQEAAIHNMRKGSVECKTCVDAKHEREAKAHGWTLIGPGKNAKYRTYRRIECGHEQEAAIHNMRRGEVECRTCTPFHDLAAEAKAHGWTLIGPSKNKAHRTYRRIECGHEQEARPLHIRLDQVACRQCDESVWDGPGHVYLFRLTHPTVGEAMKPGLAKSPESRISTIKPRDGVTIDIIDSILFPDYRAAHRYEELLKRWARLHGAKMPVGRAKNFVSNGWSELLLPDVLPRLPRELLAFAG